MKRTISRFFFDSFSGYYDWLLTADFQITLRREFLGFIRPDKDDSLIEFGSGPGNFLSLAAPCYKSIIGLDASPRMTARAKKRLHSEQSSEKNREEINTVRCLQSELDDYTSDIQYDSAVAVSFLYLVENRRSALEQMVKSVRPGGAIALMEPSDDFCAITAKQCGKKHDFGIRDRFSLHNWLRSVQLHGGLSAEELHAYLTDNNLQDIIIKPALSGLVLFARAIRKG